MHYISFKTKRVKLRCFALYFPRLIPQKAEGVIWMATMLAGCHVMTTFEFTLFSTFQVDEG